MSLLYYSEWINANLISVNGSFIDELKDCVSIMLTESMERFRDELAEVVGTEVRAELSRQTDEIMEELGVLSDVKCQVQTCSEKVKDSLEFMNETVEVVTVSTSDINSKLQCLQQTLDSTKADFDSISKSRTQLSTISALLQETLKVLST